MGMISKNHDTAYYGEAAMGCDIHFVVERRVSTPDGAWIGVYSTSLTPRLPMRSYDDHKLPSMSNCAPTMQGRNYEFFAKLAGVRGEGPEPKGFPDDASELAVMDSAGWGSDGHSHSWCSFDEFVKAHIATTDSSLYKKLLVEKLKGEEQSILDHLFWENEHERKNLRVVFWFDN
jgi:hypothetical protein